jgi:carbon-monoxide dehydrogenase medium subunit
VKAAPFAYARPTTVEEAVEMLAATGGEGKVLAGGQSLVPILAMRLARPSTLVDLNGVEGLDRLTVGGGGGGRSPAPSGGDW